MASATFSHTAGSVVLSRTPHRPDVSLAVVQPQRRSADDLRFGYAHTITNNLLRLKIRATAAEKDALILFFNTIAKGMAELITYTDPLGSALAVRFAQDNITALEKGFNAWDINVVLRIFGGAWQWDSGVNLAWDTGVGVGY